MSDIADKVGEARAAILDTIIKNAAGNATYVLELAEAYAWISYPNNPHGGAKIENK